MSAPLRRLALQLQPLAAGLPRTAQTLGQPRVAAAAQVAFKSTGGKKKKGKGKAQEGDEQQQQQQHEPDSSSSGGGGGFFSDFMKEVRKGIDENPEMRESLDKLKKGAGQFGAAAEGSSTASSHSDKTAANKESAAAGDAAGDDAPKKESGWQGLRSRFRSFVAQAEQEREEAAAAKAKGTTTDTSPPPPPPPSSSSSSSSSASASASSAAGAASSSSQSTASAGDSGPRQRRRRMDKKEEEDFFAKTGPFTKLVEGVKFLKQELLDDNTYMQRSEPYQAPVERRRAKIERPARPQKAVEANEEATGVVMHKDSAWQRNWSKFKDNNPIVDGLFGLKMRFDESDNIFVRATRSVTDMLGERFGSVFADGEMAETLREITKIDPSFDQDEFLLHCEKNVIPAVLEAYLAGDKETLKGWCAEPAYNLLSAQIEQREAAGLVVDSKVLDLRNVELLMAKIMDDSPVLIMSFQAQQATCVRDKTGAIREGGEDHIERVFYIFAMRRNQDEFDPRLAWEVLEVGIQFSQENW